MRRQRILSKMKRVEVVVTAERLAALVKIIEENATGYTVLPVHSGQGAHGYHDQGEQVLVVTVVTPEHLETIVDAILPSLGQAANIVLITDVTVLRAEHFIPEVRAALSRSKT